MKIEELTGIFQRFSAVEKISFLLSSEKRSRIHLNGLKGSEGAFIGAGVFKNIRGVHVFILPEKESAAYFFNDLESLFSEKDLEYSKRKILFFPTSYKKAYEIEKTDNSNILLRSEVLSKINKKTSGLVVVTYPEALAEKVVSKKVISKNTLRLKKADKVSFDFMLDVLIEYNFERVDFVAEPGQFSVRGGIIDVFSFSNDYPYRIEFFGEEVDSIRTFDPGSQLSLTMLADITIVPNFRKQDIKEERISLAEFISKNSCFWINDTKFAIERMNLELEKISENSRQDENDEDWINPAGLFISGDNFLKELLDFSVVEFGNHYFLKSTEKISFNSLPQLSFNKNFDLLINELDSNTKKGIHNLLFCSNPKQAERLRTIIDDICFKNGKKNSLDIFIYNVAIHEGFIDKDLKIACYTDHQIFERYFRFHLRESKKGREVITLREIYNLQPGDYVTHIDHGIGKFDGLETINNNGKEQEALRMVYKNGDLLYVSIHSLHRIAKYVGKEGTAPPLNRLGSNNWNRLKERTKKKIKDIAKDLIKLYAQRKSASGFSFTPDTYLQHELEASFIFEDTPDQLKSTMDVKADMEKKYPMDRLICGDVGFGKTEIAIRAAFKTVADSKQVAVLVPTTILALQHYKTFSDRLEDFPCNVEYINRFKSRKEQTRILKELAEGKIDILIGTHRLVGKDLKFKDLGLLIIDEEQKFGVAVKEKLRQLKIDVDTLTLTATPIPRTLQFSLLGARDLSVMNTPPPNRIPIQTEVRGFSEEVIKDAVNYEISRNGQVFFVHNRIYNIVEVADMIRKFCPDAKIRIGHGQLEGSTLEKVMLDFIEGDFDVLVSTSIIENGLDIPNANTIIVNNAQNFGLSDLHQLRGRVGRANKKAFCYLLSPPLATLTPDAARRLRAIEEFTSLGSGFNIAMRDLDIRGAGNLLGAEQSGFISDIGYEMYHKILDEAMLELREDEFKDVFKNQEDKKQEFVRDCQIETDLEILIPNDYISVITERLSIYKELDNIEDERTLLEFRKKMIDRFGPMPKPADALFSTIRLRWLARKIGLEKLILKNNKLIGYFIKKQESEYYQSEAFTAVLDFIKSNPRACKMHEMKQKLRIVFDNVKSINDAIRTLLPLEAKPHDAG